MRSKNVAGILALLLGGLGVHKFYLGRPFQGLIYLLLCWTFVPAGIALIEAAYYFLMSEEAFAVRYGGADAVSPETHVRCPDCRELVRKDARKCRHCGTPLIPIA